MDWVLGHMALTAVYWHENDLRGIGYGDVLVQVLLGS